MTDCDICGKPAITQAIVEGARLSVCQRCLSFGREVSKKQVRPRPGFAPRKEMDVVEGYGKLVSQAREKAKMTRTGLARQLNMFENVLERIEAEVLRPDEDVAKKLEKVLGVTLLVEAKANGEASAPALPQDEGHSRDSRRQSRELTLADIVTIKKK